MPVLKSQDDSLFRVTKEELKSSVLLTTLLDDFEHLQLEEDATKERKDSLLSGGEQPIPVDVSEPVLAKIITWLRYQKSTGISEEEINGTVTMKGDKYVMSEWEMSFVDETPAILMELLAAADYLDIGNLKDLVGRSFQNLLAGKTPPQIREILGLDKEESNEQQDKPEDHKENKPKNKQEDHKKDCC